jgi:LDH2 family malate/lactate/ureidoglycolate dehydrogenase
VHAGRVAANPTIAIEQRTPSVVAIDAGHAFGHHSGSVAIAETVRMAEATGIAAAAVANSTHFGAAGYFALQASRRGFIGLAFTNADALVKLHGGNVPYFGTNPICVTAPLANEEPFCLDMATSAVSWNRVKNHPRDVPLGTGWAHDEHGQPTTDPAAARMLEASGGYKGYGLGMVVDIFCGLLAGGPVGREILAMYKAPIEARRFISHFFIAIDPEKFVGRAALATRLQTIVDDIRSRGVMVAGDPEKKAFAERSRSGIPIDDAKLAEFIAVAPATRDAVMS